MLRNRPLVSVIMPAYNGEKYIYEAIESVRRQSYPYWELLIIDDCSRDSTVGIVQSFNDSRIFLKKNKSNKGIAESTNLGIECSRGEYIALLDDDDIAIQDRLELQVEYLQEHPEIDILGGRYICIDSDGKYLNSQGLLVKNPKRIKADYLVGYNTFANGTTMMRKNALEKYGLRYKDPSYGMQDFRFFIEASPYCTFGTIDNVLLKTRLHENNETKKQMAKSDRAVFFAKLQRESFALNGFELSDRCLKVFNECIRETKVECDSMEKLEQIYLAFAEILEKARLLEIDYYNELELVLLNLFAKAARGNGFFVDSSYACNSFWNRENS